jgi:DNA-binding MarR family transcriptional regulator
MQVSAVCEQSAVPPTTAIRWIKIMADEGLLLRQPDPFDGRRVFLELSPSASEGMHAFFDHIQGLAPV